MDVSTYTSLLSIPARKNWLALSDYISRTYQRWARASLLHSRFASVHDHVNSIFWQENMSSKNRAASDFRPTRTSTRPLLKQLARNTQKYCRIKLHCLVITKSVELFRFFIRQLHQRVNKLSHRLSRAGQHYLPHPLPRLQKADRNQTLAYHSWLLWHHHYNQFVLNNCVKKIPAHSTILQVIPSIHSTRSNTPGTV